ncbi:hypothetical protein G6O67_001267 [Ophiocordyceps sinensis]|uniref:Uncharacterized protein n=2 Tax=Ophiocordyceps sinensis TaxID=72228 RepID=A0A8H4PXC8_9HYPO|nr:hypothetical protein OCS_03439 [Ophiocordyceps sinensis CO18]KAF4512085.1 hypothetical protein G6O67_001267 [Ophiocordyceps sinensis]
MARAPTRNSPVPVNANGGSAVSHVSPDTPFAAPASTSDVGGSDTSRAPTAMASLSRPAATSSTKWSSPTMSSTAIATPSAPVVALGLPPFPPDSADSRDQSPKGGVNINRDQNDNGKGVNVEEKVPDGQKRNRKVEGQPRNRGGGERKGGSQPQNQNQGQRKEKGGIQQGGNQRTDDERNDEKSRDGATPNQPKDNRNKKGERGKNGQRKGDEKGKGAGRTDEKGQRDNLAQPSAPGQRQGSSSVPESPPARSKASTSSASSARPVPSRTSTSRSTSFLSKSTSTSVERASQSPVKERQSPPAPQKVQSEENRNPPKGLSTSFLSTSTFTTAEPASQSASVPQRARDPPPPQNGLPTSSPSTSTFTTAEPASQSASMPQRAPDPPPPQNGLPTSFLSTSTFTTAEPASQSASVPQRAQDPPPPQIVQASPPAREPDEAPNPPVETTQSQTSEQAPSASTFTRPAPPDSSAPTPSPAPRLNPEINPSLQDDPVSRPTTTPNNAESTDSQDAAVRPPSKTRDSVPVAIPVKTESPIPSLVLGDTGPDSRKPPSNSIPLGGNPKGLGDSGGVPKTNPAPAQSSQTSRGLSTGGVVGISVGSLAAILLIGLALWAWRKSVAKKRENRSPGPFGESAYKLGEASEENGSALGTRTGIGKPASSLGLFKGGSKSRAAVAGASTNRYTSPFWNMPAAPRDDGALAPPMSNGLTVKDRVVDWWTRRAEERDFDTRLRADPGRSLGGGASGKGSLVRAPSEYRPQLDLSFDRSGSLDPFSDNNASLYNATYATQLPRANFSDNNDSSYNATYAAQLPRANPFVDPTQRSFWTDQPLAIPPRAHGRSRSESVRDSYYPPRPALRPDSGIRESLQSVRRNKCRSDPFDLEIESRLIPSADDVAQMPRLTGMSSTYSYHTRGASLPYSEYSSGVSLSDWSIMGADLGLATGPTMGEQGRPSESAGRPRGGGHPQGGGGVRRAK